ncbi:MAG TPA: hypothetical protein VNR65_05600, partial [Geobacterales bacterium]|nr:hypothetical protein [Geobacterales bacterium]
SLRDGEFTCCDLCGIGHELFNLVLDLVSDAAVHFFLLIGQSTGGIWVYDIPVQNAEREGKYRIPFLGRITDGDHMAERFFQ